MLYPSIYVDVWFKNINNNKVLSVKRGWDMWCKLAR